MNGNNKENVILVGQRNKRMDGTRNDKDSNSYKRKKHCFKCQSLSVCSFVFIDHVLRLYSADFFVSSLCFFASSMKSVSNVAIIRESEEKGYCAQFC